MKAENLKIGDVVRLVPDTGNAFNDLTVINKTEKFIKFFRPYVSLADFTHVGGVIPYIGVEQFEAYIDSTVEYVLLDNIYRENVSIAKKLLNWKNLCIR